MEPPLDLDYHSLIIYHWAIPEDCVCIAMLRLLDTRLASRLDGLRGRGRNSLVCMNIFGQRSENTTSIRRVQRLDVRLDCDWAATRLRLDCDWGAEDNFVARNLEMELRHLLPVVSRIKTTSEDSLGSICVQQGPSGGTSRPWIPAGREASNSRSCCGNLSGQ